MWGMDESLNADSNTSMSVSCRALGPDGADGSHCKVHAPPPRASVTTVQVRLCLCHSSPQPACQRSGSIWEAVALCGICSQRAS